MKKHQFFIFDSILVQTLYVRQRWTFVSDLNLGEPEDWRVHKVVTLERVPITTNGPFNMI